MLDFLILLIFVVVSIGFGLHARRKASQNLEEYFLAGKTLSGWQAGISMAATQFAADTPLLVTGLIATAGIFALWRLWIYGVAFLLMAFILAPCWRRAGVLTDAELTEIRYSGKGVLLLRILKAFYYGTLINCVVMAMVLIAAIRIAEVFLPWHEWLPNIMYQPFYRLTQFFHLDMTSAITQLHPSIASTNNLISIFALLAFTALYSMTGGLRSVVLTDIFQFTIAMVGTLLYAFIVVKKIGGMDELIHKLYIYYGDEVAQQRLSLFPPLSQCFIPFVVVISLQWVFQMNSDGTGYLAQRTMACRTDQDARLAGVIFTWVQILLRSLIWVVIGVALLVLYPVTIEQFQSADFAGQREALFVFGINDHLPMGVRGLMLTGLLAALASTIDTHLNWGASYWSNDIYQRLICQAWQKRTPHRRELVLVARLSNIVILVLAIIVMMNLGSIEKAWLLSLLFGAGMGAVLVLRWLWERINLYSELASIIVSLVMAPILLIWVTDEWLRLLYMAVTSSLAAILITFVTPPTHPHVLKKFYERVRPVGFWHMSAQLAGRPRGEAFTKFKFLSRVTLSSVCSLFLILTGSVRLLLPIPGGFSWTSWILILAGLVLCPFWIGKMRLMNQEPSEKY
ncbi:Na+:solute symporter [PVC group bacterium]|nr:Na+:solute symporter [PVC group bacterium]